MKKFPISNFQFPNRKGFTLIELLTVIGILSVVGTLVVSILSVTLRGTKKADLIENARQSGDAALSQMVKSIRYSQGFSCANTPQSIMVTSLTDYAQTTYRCGVGTIASNSASLFDTNAITVSSCSFVCAQRTIADPPTVTIQFTLSPAHPGSFSETNFTLPFQSSVTMRNN